MKLKILGNCGPFEGPGGACSSYLVSEGGANLVLDMGNGSLANLIGTIGLCDVNAIVLSHLHFDHVSDIFVFKYALGSLKGRKKIPLFMPKTPERMFDIISEGDMFDVMPMEDGMCAEAAGFKLRFSKMTHPVESYATEVMGKDGKKIVYSGDTNMNPKLKSLFTGADICLVDAGLINGSVKAPHLTIREACEVAKGAKRVILTHFSPNNAKEDMFKEVHSGAEMCSIGEVYTV